MTTRCWAEIDLGALRHNVWAVRAGLAPGVQVMGVIKADAYGHGAAVAAGALAGSVEMFGVANLREAEQVRERAPGVPILVLGPALSAERAGLVAQGFHVSVSSLEEARAYGVLGGEAKVHVILDTGMGRMGLWEEEAAAVLPELARVPGVEVVGVASHLPSADEDAQFTVEQLARFNRLMEYWPAGVPRPMRHVENSAGALGYPAQAGQMVRLGLALYGCAPLAEHQGRLRPALTWKARISLIREVGAGRGVSYGRTFITPHAMRIGTVAVGYADGFPRHLSNRGAEVLVGGRRCAVLGRVTMDQILVDLTARPEAREGDEVVLLGRQGDEEILVAEMAAKAGTIPWEVFTGLGMRVERHYTDGDGV